MSWCAEGRGALVAEKFAAKGCNVAVNYNSSKDRAEQVVANVQERYEVKGLVIHGDMGILADCEKTVHEAIDGLGGLDIIIANAGWTKFTTFGDLDALTEEEWDKCWAVNCKSNLHLLRKALPTFNANPDGGVFLVTSSVAGISVSGSTMAYSTTKAAGLHLVKCLAATQGPRVRVNAILPGLLLTEWGANFTPEKIQSSKDKAYLKKETELEDCADAFVATAINSSMTGQNIQIDSGLAMLGQAR
ncbi:hypothetical protein ACLMJK_007272 [Lecanora helva]